MRHHAAGALALATVLTVAGGLDARAQTSDDVVRVGVLTDMGGIFSDNTGAGSVIAARMAIEDFGGTVNGKPIDLVSGDHQNKPDVAANLARRWFDEQGVDVIADIIGSSVTYAVLQIANQKDRALLMTGAGASDLTGPNCSPISVHWVWDTYSFGGVLGKAGAERGAKKFFFITVDYSYGEQMQRDTARAVEAAGATVVGSVKHPFGTADFSSYVLAAQASGADAVAMANAGGDTLNAVKQATEFGLPASGMQIAAILGLKEMAAAGPQVVQGVLAPSSWYWDMDEKSRAFARRFEARSGGVPPTEFQVGVYSAVLHYLEAVKAAGTDEAKAVVAKMKDLPVDDVFARNATLRQDGRLVHDMYLIEGKGAGESTGKWDVAKILATVPGDQAFRPLGEGGCPLVK